MHLKKAAFLLTLIMTTVSNADYEVFNVFGSIGAGFGMGGELYTSVTVDGTSRTEKDKFFNYGSGVKYRLGCQYFMMDNLILQPSFTYSNALAFKVDSSFSNSSTKTTYQRQLFGIKVSILPKFEFLDLIDVYTGVGIGFFWNGCSFERIDESTTGTQKAKGSIGTSTSFGFTGLLGANFPLSDKLTIFGETGFEQMNFDLKHIIIDESNITGLEVGKTYYSKDDSNTDNLDPVKVSGSNFQLHIGVRYALF
jgi:opacity protein-like surface antigen